MLSIGEFSKICQVSTKTLRYYAEIGLILPDEINLENGYRYYSIDQLETMLFINRLKSYNFSLEEIKEILENLFLMRTVYDEELDEKNKFYCRPFRLKKVNDNYGHSYGDEYIRLATEAIKKAVGKLGISYRLGGDEFVVFAGMTQKQVESTLLELKHTTEK